MPRRTLGPSSLQVNKLTAELSEKRERIAASVKYRDDLLKTQQRSNYINEYDRLRGEIERRRVRGLLSINLKNRQSDLKKLAKQSLDVPTHDIYIVFVIIYNLKMATFKSSGMNPVGLHKKQHLMN